MLNTLPLSMRTASWKVEIHFVNCDAGYQGGYPAQTLSSVDQAPYCLDNIRVASTGRFPTKTTSSSTFQPEACDLRDSTRLRHQNHAECAVDIAIFDQIYLAGGLQERPCTPCTSLQDTQNLTTESWRLTASISGTLHLRSRPLRSCHAGNNLIDFLASIRK